MSLPLLSRLRTRIQRSPSGEDGPALDLDTLEENLLLADVGATTTAELVAAAEKAGGRDNARAATEALRERLDAILEPFAQPLAVNDSARPFVILMTGVNGSGKTTTIAKLAHRLRTEGKSIMLAAATRFAPPRSNNSRLGASAKACPSSPSAPVPIPPPSPSMPGRRRGRGAPTC